VAERLAASQDRIRTIVLLLLLLLLLLFNLFLSAEYIIKLIVNYYNFIRSLEVYMETEFGINSFLNIQFAVNTDQNANERRGNCIP
jgi:hypothetical protein